MHLAAKAKSKEVVQLLHCKSPTLNTKSSDGSTPLHIAAANDTFVIIPVLLQLGALKDEVNQSGQSALFIAADRGARESVKVLTDEGCDLGLKASDGRTAIHAAANSGQPAIMRRILRKRAHERLDLLFAIQSTTGESPMHAAVRGANAKGVKDLLQAGATATLCDELGFTPLHYATSFGHQSMIFDILDTVRDANPRNDTGNTPLHSAASGGRSDCIEQLFKDCSALGLSVEIDPQNDSLQTPFMLALTNTHEAAANLLLTKQPASLPDTYGSYPVHFAAQSGFDTVVRTLSTYEDAAARDAAGRTALSSAAAAGRLSTLKLLVASHPEMVLTQDNYGISPALAALSAKHVECTKFLLDNGADPNVADLYGNTLLHEAALIGDLDMLVRLLSLGCSFTARNWVGETAFHKAVEGNNLDVVVKLIQVGYPDVNARNDLGDTPVMIAAQQGNLAMLSKLDWYGAEFGDQNLAGRTAVHAAALRGHLEILQFLKYCGEDMKLGDQAGQTPLLNAANEGYSEAVKFLLRDATSTVNTVNEWDSESPLLAAAKGCFPLTIKALLASGADVHHRDVFGRSAVDYASRSQACLQALETATAGVSPLSTSELEHVLRSTIVRCCEALVHSPQNPSAAELFPWLCAVDVLSTALHELEDYDSALICYKRMFWPPQFDPFCVTFLCGFCGAKQFTGDKYICKACRPRMMLCDGCHKDYVAAGHQTPKAVLEIRDLERYVQPMRVAAEGVELLNVLGAVLRLQALHVVLSDMNDKYGAWEQKYNSTNNFAELERPGSEFVKLLKETQVLATKVGDKVLAAQRAGEQHVNDLEDLERKAELEKEYDAHQRLCAPHKEIPDCLCQGHEYLHVPATNATDAAGAGTENRSNDVITTFVATLRERYSAGQRGNATEGEVDLTSERLERDDVIPAVANVGENQSADGVASVTSTRPKEVRAASVAEQPAPALAIATQTNLGRVTLGPIRSPIQGNPAHGDRAFSLPVATELQTSVTARASTLAMEDADALTDTDGTFGGQTRRRALSFVAESHQKPTMKRAMTSPVSSRHRSLKDGDEPSVGSATDRHETEQPRSDASPPPLLAPTFSDEPETMEDSTIPEDAWNIVLGQSLESTRFITDLRCQVARPAASEAMRQALRIPLTLPFFQEQTYRDCYHLVFAVSFTEAMIPGFATVYSGILHDQVRDGIFGDQTGNQPTQNDAVAAAGASDSDDSSDDDDDE